MTRSTLSAKKHRDGSATFSRRVSKRELAQLKRLMNKGTFGALMMGGRGEPTAEDMLFLIKRLGMKRPFTNPKHPGVMFMLDGPAGAELARYQAIENGLIDIISDKSGEFQDFVTVRLDWKTFSFLRDSTPTIRGRELLTT